MIKETKAQKKGAQTKGGKKVKGSAITLLEAIEQVVHLSEDTELSEAFLKKAHPWTSHLAQRYGISERQAVLFCISMEKGPRRVDYNDLARHLGVSHIRALSFASDIDALVHRRLLRYRDAKEEDTFDVHQPVIRALKHNEVYELPQRSGLDCAALFEVLNMLFDDFSDETITALDLQGELEALFDENPQINFVKQINELPLHTEDLLLLLLFCHLLINKDDDDIRFSQMEDIFEEKGNYNRAKAELRSGTHELIRHRLIEHRNANGIADTSRYQLTAEAKRTLLGEMKLFDTEEKLSDVLVHESLTPKKLFYPQPIQGQVSELMTFFTPEEYNRIRQRMHERGFRHGFACLFYGGPGTGKTETVYQMARQTGRDIMVVDVPQIKSKWVGDSEKNIKALFDRYRDMVKRAKVAPILLFNEADAIISTRKTGACNAVDKMENTLQNIILQEMENLDGIMIATTNLEGNLDAAFERRFLYKIRFDKPDSAVRSKIWKQMIPELSPQEATTLATAHDFSGGQIENIARKHAIHAVLHGEPECLLSQLQSYCTAERLNATSGRSKVGF